MKGRRVVIPGESRDTGPARVIRGCSCIFPPESLRVADRRECQPGFGFGLFFGSRLVLEVR